MTRRELLAFLGLALLTMPAGAAGQSHRIFRVGYLGGGAPSPDNPALVGFVRGLREQGYVEGQNLAIEYRWTTGNNEGFAPLAAELVRLNVDVIVAHATPAVRAAKAATKTIPIVLLNIADPVGEGLVASLAHPGGNITGISNQTADFIGKLVQLSKETLPRLARLAVIAPTSEGAVLGPGTRARIKELETAASPWSIAIHPLVVRDAGDLPHAFTKASDQKDQAVVILPDHMTWFHRVQILDLAARNKLPTICIFEVWAQAGCLVGYGPNIPELWYRAGLAAGKLLKGSKPGDLPVEQPTKFELAINVRTARVLGLTIPPSLLLRADHVIE